VIASSPVGGVAAATRDVLMNLKFGVRRLPLLLSLCTLVLVGRTSPVWARAGGFTAGSCDTCHQGGAKPAITVTMDPMVVDPGATATVTVKVTVVNGGPVGFYIQSRGAGAFTELPGQGTRLATSTEVVHSAPKRGTGPDVSFQMKWTAPQTKGAYLFEVVAVSANGNNQPSGDGAGAGRLAFTVGCPGIEVFVDVDGDGYGSDTVPSSRACDLQPGFAMQKGDCNDYRANAHPGAKEICDDVDNNCDGQINEGLASGTYYKDGDGDGYGDRFGTDTRTGCSPGYASTRDDCNDMDKEIHPGAKETCNNVDDNCNGRIDENAKLSCGMGWCRRTADTCASTLCTPGMPQPETCNLVDDDCDGVIDNNARCADGKVCVNGGCISSEDAKMIMAMSDASVPSGSGGPDGGTRADTPPSPPMGGNVDAPRRANASGCQYGGGGAGFGLAGLALVLGLFYRRRDPR
jgi:hypothetical protein